MNRLGRLALALSVCLTAQQISAQTPLISAGGVLNAASFAPPGVLSPGAIFGVSGTSLSDGTTAVAAPGASSLPTRLAGARVLVNGVAAPLFYVSPGVIDAQFPVELAAITTASVQVEVQSAVGTVNSPAITVTVSPYAPGIFTLDENGSGPGAIFRASDNSQICPPGRRDCSANPAIPGEVVSIYMTGLGAVNGPWSSGQPAQLASSTVTTPLVTVGGTQAQVLFSGLARASVGLYQVDVIVPASLSAGDSVPLGVSIGSTASNQVTISIGTASAASVSPQGGGPPGGGAVTAIAVDPVHRYTLYTVAPIGGVFKSTNGGQGWTAVNNGLPIAPVSPVSVLLVDPSNPAIVYAGIHGSGPNDGVYKSTDGGASWTPIRNGLTRGISCLAIARANTSILYASTNANGVFRSTDGGANWTLADNGLPSSFISMLVVDPLNPDIVYAGVTSERAALGLWKSTDGGTNWSATGLSDGHVTTLAIDPQNPATIYAGTNNGGVFKSTDGGANWNASSLSGGAVTTLAIDPQNPAILYAGTSNGGVFNNGAVFKSTDGGTSWSATSLSAGSVNALAIDPLSASTLYAASSFGLSKSVDGGASWTVASSGFTNTSVSALVIDPVNSATLYVGAQGRGVFQSTDGGASWTALNNALTGATVLVLAIDPLNPATVYAGTQGGGAFKSTDGGQNWKPINSGLTATNNQPLVVQTLVIDPRNPATIIDPLNPATLYAGGPSGGSRPNAFLSKSTNAGASWTALDTVPQPLSALVIDPRTPSTIYAQTVVGILLKSSNGGGSFIYTGNGMPPSSALVIDPVNPATLYAGRPDGTVYKSTSGGASWVPASSGLPASAVIVKLVIDPRNPSTLYAGTSNEGVFKSTDGGASWQPTGAN